jgi:hypothetical protein
VRILNYPRLLVTIGLCSLANLAGLPNFMSAALAQPAALTASQSEALSGTSIGGPRR